MKLIFIVTMMFCSIFLQAPLLANETIKPPKISGFIQSDFYQSKDGRIDSQESSFHIRRARLGITGKVMPKLSYKILAAFDGGNNNSADLKAFDVFAKYQLSDNHSLTMGQFKYTFDREGRLPAHQAPFMYFSLPTSGLIAKLGRSGAALRDVGIELAGKRKIGDSKHLRYSMGVINGNGINTTDHTPDSSSNRKDYYGRASIDLFTGLNVGGGIYEGSFSDDNGNTNLSEQIWTLDAYYSYQNLTLMGVISEGKYETAGNDVSPGGFSITGSYALNANIDLLVRYQQFERDQNTSDTELTRIDLGINYYFSKKGKWGGTRLMVNYVIRDADALARSRLWSDRGDLLTGDEINDVFAARFQLVF